MSRTDASAKRPSAGVYRPEIEGLRTVAFLLVAIFHIWFNRVSGGVDVFFTVAGFLITLTLVGQVRRFGKIQGGVFFGKLLARLLPSAVVVLVAVAGLTVMLQPYGVWREGAMQIFASAAYWQNWYLAFNSVDYLAVDTVRSPVQHFWAMSIQGQFYVIWFLIFMVAIVVAVRAKRNFRRAAFVLIALITVASFVWSVYQTASNQQFAYFSTFTRVWEFGIGSLLALVIHRIKVPMFFGALVSWIALAAIITVGLVLPVADMFPGWVALIPVAAAVVIIATGQTQASWGASRLLASKPLVWLGGLGYGVYLWHWPMLVFALEVQGRTKAGWKTGTVIIVASIFLAWCTKKFVEQPVLTLRSSTNIRIRQVAIMACSLAGLLVAGSGIGGVAVIDHRANEEKRAAVELSEDPCFGAGVLFENRDCSGDVSELVLPADPTNDMPEIFYGECATKSDSSEVKRCSWGDEDADTRIALVGNSHAAVWFPALRHVAEQYGWRLDTYYREACVFNDFARESAGKRGTVPQKTCSKWNDNLDEYLENQPPYSYVLTSAIGLNLNYYDEDTGEEGLELGVAGFHAAWQPLIDRGATILAVRDYPRLDEAAIECALEQFETDCSVDSKVALADEADEVLAVAANTIEGATSVDMSRWFCSDGSCPTTIGGVRVYRDHAHFTATYGETLGEPLSIELRRQGGLPALP